MEETKARRPSGLTRTPNGTPPTSTKLVPAAGSRGPDAAGAEQPGTPAGRVFPAPAGRRALAAGLGAGDVAVHPAATKPASTSPSTSSRGAGRTPVAWRRMGRS